MPIIQMNAKSIAKLKPIAGKRAQYFDKAVPGLTLRITATGVRTWSLWYRHRGRSRRVTIGDAKNIGLADARTTAREHLRDVSKGKDPGFEKQAAKGVATFGTFAIDVYLEQHAKRKKRSWKVDEQQLRLYVLPAWRHRAMVDITRAAATELLEDIATRGPILANRVRALLHRLFEFAIERGVIEANPITHTARPGNERARDRVLTKDEIRTLWEAFSGLDGPMAAYFKLRLLTAQRGGEVRDMRWADVDLTAGWWTIPATSTKNKLAHRVPLTPSVVALLKTLAPADDDDDDDRIYVLDGARGKRQQAEAAATFTVKDFRGHDLRRTAASLMTAGGVSRLVVGKILNHVERTVTAVYDRHSYDAEKQAALAWWDVTLTAIIANTSGTVVAFSRGA